MSGVTVLDTRAVTPRADPENGLIVRATFGADTGLELLEQALLECPPGRCGPIGVGETEETMFVVSGHGAIEVRGETHDLEPEVGVYLPPGAQFSLTCDSPEPLRLIAVRTPDPKPGPPARPAIRRVSDAEAQAATANREFRIVADPDSGLRSATHFVGYIPTERAPDHFHTYDEVIYVLEGQGVMHAGDLAEPVAAGSCIQLPAKTVHCLENTGEEPMRVVGVFRPPGSPAAAFYPDGTPAYQEPASRRS